MIRAIVTDIEGTTGSIAFVHEVLFPYARRQLGDFVRQHYQQADVARQLEATREEAAEPDADIERLIAILEGWIQEDRKATPLKALQGMVWEAGYQAGDFTGHVYPDAAEALMRWHEQGYALYVYSSGSIQAQRLLFGHSDVGDLTPLFAGYFDTTTGPKREAESYRRIVEAIGHAPQEILFLSDVVAELDAARAAGLATCQLVREPGMTTGEHPLATRFDEVSLDGMGRDAASFDESHRAEAHCESGGSNDRR
ncbi:acireductone synthase [Onishia taeanensis]|uniref:Enolase-phosphatase E1 n=1 Tax=Onishia taeanensis TaxID=284577 RepID=A0A1G7PBJ6_9GAMM|nr:acireductone synthase [Halomonas taeanensis]SDF83676.1 acireductone synthase [Halomonas taeanensis]